jgi:bacterioferritin (cytochrome b1)
MLRLDEGAEYEAITLYKQTIKVATDKGDTKTRRLFKKILAEEEEHIDIRKTACCDDSAFRSRNITS